MPTTPSYLTPYLNASHQHKGGFGTLLWASEHTQHLRFNAFTRLCNFAGKSILDAGCGRADLLSWLIQHQQVPHDYFGIEALDVLAQTAQSRNLPNCTIIEDDFVTNPSRLFVGAEIVVFCGSLNTLNQQQFEQVLMRAFDATAEMLVFNFLCSPERAASAYLLWHHIDDVLKLAGRMTDSVQYIDDYLPGDCAMILKKKDSDL